MEYQHIIHFSLAEARALLPGIIEKLEEIRELKFILDERGYDIRAHQILANLGTNGTKPHPEEADQIIRLAHELTQQGIQIKDFDRGLIDFPTIRSNGEEVYLCYQLGEPDIQYWHQIRDGFPGRKGIDSL